MTLKNSEIAEMFAHGEIKGYNKHMYIEGSTIYSYGYHFPIAKRYGKNLYLFNSHGYSNTTRHHKSLVMQVISSHNAIIIHLPDCKVLKAQEQLDVNNRAINEYKEKLKGARTRHEYYESGIRHFKEQNKLIERMIIPTIIAEKI
jgi:hypothetical protein